MKKLILLLVLFTELLSAQNIQQRGTLVPIGTHSLGAFAYPWDSLYVNWIGKDLIPGLPNTYKLGSDAYPWLNASISEMHTTIFSKATQTLEGGNFRVGKNVGTLAGGADASSTTMYFGQTMMPGDIVEFKGVDASGNAKYEAVRVISLVTGTIYNVARDLDLSGKNIWYIGTPYSVRGQGGNGWIDFNAYTTPRFSMSVQRDSIYAHYNEVLRIGDLNGIYGYNSELYGVVIGIDSNNSSYITSEPLKGIRFMHRGSSASDTTTMMRFTMDGTAIFKVGLIGNTSISGDSLIGGVIKTASVGQRIVMSGTTNDIRFYNSSGTNILAIGDTANGIGTPPGMQVNDGMIVSQSSLNYPTIYGMNKAGGYGVYGLSTNSYGVVGYSLNSYGGYFTSDNSYALYSQGTTYLNGKVTATDTIKGIAFTIDGNRVVEKLLAGSGVTLSANYGVITVGMDAGGIIGAAGGWMRGSNGRTYTASAADTVNIRTATSDTTGGEALFTNWGTSRFKGASTFESTILVDASIVSNLPSYGNAIIFPFATIFYTTGGANTRFANNYWFDGGGSTVRRVNGTVQGIQLQSSAGRVQLFTSLYGAAGVTPSLNTIVMDSLGNLGVGINTNAGARIESRSTTKQIMASYDAATYYDLTVASNGATTQATTGTAASMIFVPANGVVNVTGSIKIDDSYWGFTIGARVDVQRIDYPDAATGYRFLSAANAVLAYINPTGFQTAGIITLPNSQTLTGVASAVNFSGGINTIGSIKVDNSYWGWTMGATSGTQRIDYPDASTGFRFIDAADAVMAYIKPTGITTAGIFTLPNSQTLAGNVSSIGFNNGITLGNTYTASSSSYVSGFSGSGWKIDYNTGNYSLTVDNLYVRNRMTVYEEVINQLRASNGSVVISSTGKVAAVSGGPTYTIKTDGGSKHGFFAGDIVRAKRYSVASAYDSWLTVGTVTNDTMFAATVLSGDVPVVGYEYVRLGSSDVSRQGSIYMTVDDANSPYIDVRDGVTSVASFSDPANTKARLGKLTGITDALFGTLTGYGLYSQNVFLTGGINATSGKIGAWSLDANKLYGHVGSSYSAIALNNAGGGYAFFAGASDTAGTGATFKVTPAGVLTATGANISGSITLTAGSSVSYSYVSGLGSLATQSSVDYSDVSGLGSLATQSSVDYSDVSGLGGLATKSSVDLNSGDVTNKSLANLDAGANNKLAGIANGATVGATWGTDLSSIPSYLQSTAPDNSLSLTSTFFGFHATGANWPVRIANDGGVGKLYAGNGSTQYISWNGTNLDIHGSVTITGGNAATTSYADGVAAAAQATAIYIASSNTTTIIGNTVNTSYVNALNITALGSVTAGSFTGITVSTAASGHDRIVLNGGYSTLEFYNASNTLLGSLRYEPGHAGGLDMATESGIAFTYNLHEVATQQWVTDNFVHK